MAKHPNVEVSVFLPQCSEKDKKDADSYNVKLIEAVKLPGLKPVLWLASVPDGHAMDCILGHGVALGRLIPLIKKNPNYRHCKWIQVVHTAPEEIGMYKSISEGQQMQQTEIELCEMADQVVTIAEALRKVPIGSHCIVDSEDPAEWARAIKAVCYKERNVRLAEARILRENYLQQFSWEKPCNSLVEKMYSLAFGKFSYLALRMQKF